MRNLALTTASLLFAIAIAAGCGKDKDGGGSKEIPPKPGNGSPIAAKFVKFTDGRDGRALEVEVYNFGDRTAAGYIFLARYFDANDAPLKVQPGTPFEKDNEFMSLSGGRRNLCAPKEHKTIEVEMQNVPAEAARAEVVVSKVSALADDGMKIEDWWSQESWSEWPATP